MSPHDAYFTHDYSNVGPEAQDTAADARDPTPHVSEPDSAQAVDPMYELLLCRSRDGNVPTTELAFSSAWANGPTLTVSQVQDQVASLFRRWETSKSFAEKYLRKLDMKRFERHITAGLSDLRLFRDRFHELKHRPTGAAYRDDVASLQWLLEKVHRSTPANLSDEEWLQEAANSLERGLKEEHSYEGWKYRVHKTRDSFEQAREGRSLLTPSMDLPEGTLVIIVSEMPRLAGSVQYSNVKIEWKLCGSRDGKLSTSLCDIYDCCARQMRDDQGQPVLWPLSGHRDPNFALGTLLCTLKTDAWMSTEQRATLKSAGYRNQDQLGETNEIRARFAYEALTSCRTSERVHERFGIEVLSDPNELFRIDEVYQVLGWPLESMVSSKTEERLFS